MKTHKTHITSKVAPKANNRGFTSARQTQDFFITPASPNTHDGGSKRPAPPPPPQEDTSDTDAAASAATSNAEETEIRDNSNDDKGITMASACASSKETDSSSTTTTTNGKQSRRKKKRFILFVGNLPTSASREDVVSHFEKKGVHISEFRLLTHKDSGKSKGCGFMEFSSNKVMQAALKFHRSCVQGKHVNIEMTCGGGGRTENRRNRIQEKNRKMRERKNKNSIKH